LSLTLSPHQSLAGQRTNDAPAAPAGQADEGGQRPPPRPLSLPAAAARSTG